MSQLLIPLFILLAIVLLATILWPNIGLLSRWRQLRLDNSHRVRVEDALKHILKTRLKDKVASIQSVAGALSISPDSAGSLLAQMEHGGLIQMQDGILSLTETGEEYALQVVRAHRLWEQYLAEETGYATDEWHQQAERFEHHISPQEADSLAAQLGNPSYDPHGDPIPTPEGHIRVHGGFSLTALDEGQTAQIVHIEDEPATISDQIDAKGIYPGMQIKLLEKSGGKMRVQANGDEHELLPLVADNISVVPLAEQQVKEVEPGEPLYSLKPGQKGEVLEISAQCRGPERRRLMDLGILPGTVIQAEMVSPSGDPTAYIIRDALIALRTEQAKQIKVRRVEVTTHE